nr:uncharacterized protein LOC109166947 [Ipomoea trifida]
MDDFSFDIIFIIVLLKPFQSTPSYQTTMEIPSLTDRCARVSIHCDEDRISFFFANRLLMFLQNVDAAWSSPGEASYSLVLLSNNSEFIATANGRLHGALDPFMADVMAF